MADAKVYGIDLGTTYSAISTLDDNGMPQIIENLDEGSKLLASAVYFQPGGNPVVGEVAKSQKDIEPERVVEFVKRYIGKSDAPTYEFDGVTYDPITVSALILKRLKAYADAQGHDVQNVVITCPAYFGNEEKAATKQAGIVAGLNVLDIVHEPTAAALNYCAREFKEDRKIMVYDLGGGTFDITLFDFSVKDSGEALIDIIRTIGNDRLGGIDWDSRMFDYMCSKYSEENGTDVSDMDDELKANIRSLVEQTKQDLSMLDSKNYTIKYDSDRTRIELTRKEFEERTRDLVEKTTDLVYQLLKDVELSANDVDMVLLVGGSTFMPMIRNAVEEIFPGKVRFEEPNLAVAKGAALSAVIKWAQINEVIPPAPIPAPVPNPGGTTGNVPVGKEDTTTATSVPNKSPVSGLILGGLHSIVVIDKLTHSLGPGVFVSQDKYMVNNLLFVGDEMPAEAEGLYNTMDDDVPELIVPVFENIAEDRENPFVTPSINFNGEKLYPDPELMVKHIGEIRLQLPPHTPKGTQIKAIFKASTVGLEATALNVVTGESATVVITSENTMSKEKLQETRERFKGIQTSSDI